MCLEQVFFKECIKNKTSEGGPQETCDNSEGVPSHSKKTSVLKFTEKYMGVSAVWKNILWLLRAVLSFLAIRLNTMSHCTSL